MRCLNGIKRKKVSVLWDSDSEQQREHLVSELTAPWVARNNFGSAAGGLQPQGKGGQNPGTRRTDRGKSISNNITTTCNKKKMLKEVSLGSLRTGKDAGLLEPAVATLTVSCAPQWYKLLL